MIAMAEDKDKADHKRKRVNEKKRETSKLLNSIESNGLKMQGKFLSFNSKTAFETASELHDSSTNSASAN